MIRLNRNKDFDLEKFECDLGIHDMRPEIDSEVPEGLKRLVGRNICMKGGGVSYVETGLPEWVKDSVKDIFVGDDPENPSSSSITGQYNEAMDAIADGDASKIVAGLDDSQKLALSGAEADAAQKIAGTGIYDDRDMVSRDLQNLMGTQLGQASMGGALGSARSQRAMQGALADKADEWNVNRRKVVGEGLDQLGTAGTTRRDFAQQELDAADTAAKRYFGYLHGTGTGTTSTTSGGK